MKKILDSSSTLWCFLFWSNNLRYSDSICGFAHVSNDCSDTNLPFCLLRFAARLRSSLRVSLQLSLVMFCLCIPPNNKFLWFSIDVDLLWPLLLGYYSNRYSSAFLVLLQIWTSHCWRWILSLLLMALHTLWICVESLMTLRCSRTSRSAFFLWILEV